MTSIRNWYTAQELAGLPGVPGTPQNVSAKAKREQWEGQRRLGSKAIEYSIAVLPVETRNALLKAAAESVATAPSGPAPKAAARARLPKLRAAESLTHRQILTRDARLLVVNMLKRMMQDGFSQRAACNQLLAWAANGELQDSVIAALALGNNKSGFEWSIYLNEQGPPVAEARPGQNVAAAARRLSARTLERWIDAEATGGADALAPGKRAKDLSIKPWVPYLLAEMQRPQKPHLSDAWRRMCTALPDDIEAPSYYAVQRWYSKKYSSLDKQRGRNQGSALNPHRYHRTRSAEGMTPMQEIHSEAGAPISRHRTRCLTSTSNWRFGTRTTWLHAMCSGLA